MVKRLVAVYTTETEKRKHYYDTLINVPSNEKDMGGRGGGGGGGCFRELSFGRPVQSLVKQNGSTRVSLWSVIWILSASKHSKIP